MHGRVGYYTEEHRETLLLIKELTLQGLNLSAIALLIHQESGRELMLSRIRERAARTPRTNEDVRLPISEEQIAALKAADAANFERLESSGIIRKRRDGGYDTSAALFTSARELFEQGIPSSVIARIYINFADIAQGLSKSNDPTQAARILIDLCEVLMKDLTSEERK